MRRYVGMLLALAVAVTVVACEDVPAPTSKGTRAIGAEEQEIGEAKPPPDVTPGVVPDLIGVTVGDAKDAITEAGFNVGEIGTQGLFGSPSNDWLVCTQDPEAGAEPTAKNKKKKAMVDITADRQCDISSSRG